MTTKELMIDAEADQSPWQVRLTVVWRDEQLPVPITEDARSAATAAGVRLATRPGSCVAHFVITAAAAALAIPRALTHWSDIVEEAGLPNWEIVSFSVDQIDDGELATIG